MISQSANRSCRPACRLGRSCLMRMAIGAALFTLAGCIEAELAVDAGQIPASAAEPAPVQPDLRDAARQDNIEPSLRPDPEAFHAVGFGLWDGTRTLPGIWIAHPDIAIARRVRLTNDETGAQADAAMFRRDSNLKGPRIILSSEAAEALGLTPGHATPMTIDGLIYRSNTDPDPGPQPEPVVASMPEQQDPIQQDPILADIPVEESPVNPIAPEVAPATTVIAATPAAQDPALADTATPPEAPAGDEVPAQPEPDAAILTNAAEAADDGTGEAKTLDTETIGEEVRPIINAPMPPLKASPPAPASPASPAPDGSGAITDGRHYIHAGVFGQSGNAARLAGKLRAAGLSAIEVPLTLGERKLTRVLAGPYQTIAERDAALKTIREIGPADATPGRGPTQG